MSSTASTILGSGRFPRGVHPPARKHLAEDSPVEVLPPPAKVAVALHQHTGAPCRPTVKSKQAVAAGEMIGNSDAFISAPVHSPIAGTVGRESVATLPNGRHVQTLPITADGEQLAGRALWDDVFGGDWPTRDAASREPKEIATAVRDAGIVGLGGAAFPTHVKLTGSDAKPIDTILVNGCECEPYLTADYRLMLEAPEPILAGALLAARATGAERIVVAIEDNKPAAIERMRTSRRSRSHR